MTALWRNQLLVALTAFANVVVVVNAAGEQILASGTYNNHYYELWGGKNRKWPAAKNWISTLPAREGCGSPYFVAITSEGENTFIADMMKDLPLSDRTPWIGMSDNSVEGTYLWDNGEIFDYSNWAPDEPNNNFGFGENCIQIGYGGVNEATGLNDMWNDLSCTQFTRPYIAEYDCGPSEESAISSPSEDPTKAPTASPTEGSPSPTSSPSDKTESSCAGLVTPEAEISFDDFENYDNSWVDGGVDSDPNNYDAFTQFLGRLGGNIPYTYKTFDVDPGTDHVVLEFLFYEIDLWCSCDELIMHVNDHPVDLGEFTPADEKDLPEPGGSGGISFTRESMGAPAVMGFDSRYNDQVHKFVVTIPHSYLSTGELTIGFELQVLPVVADLLSGGIDDMMLTAYDICQPTDAPTDSPTAGPTGSPTGSPTSSPTVSPTGSPTKSPTASPTGGPTGGPTNKPTDGPTVSPSVEPTESPYPSGQPSLTPTVSMSPTDDPTYSPSETSLDPTLSPTKGPTGTPTSDPTYSPSESSVDPTVAPTKSPTYSPSESSMDPTVAPTKAPTDAPIRSPTQGPTPLPTPKPTRSPLRRAPPLEPTVGPERCMVTEDNTGKQCYDFKTAEELPTGELCLEVVDDPEKLQVSYTAGDDFKLIRAQFWLGTDSEDVPMQLTGEPDYESFPYYWCKSWGMKNWTTQVKVDWEANCLGQSEFVYTMYAHSSAKQIVNGSLASQEEDAYAIETVVDDAAWFSSIDLKFHCDCESSDAPAPGPSDAPAPRPSPRSIPDWTPSPTPADLTPSPTCVMGDMAGLHIIEADDEGRECYPLIARDGSIAGSVCVTIVEVTEGVGGSETHVVDVTYKTRPGWALVKNHLWAGQDISEVPTMLGKLDMHHFPHFYCDFTGMNEWTARVNLNLACDTAFSVVAYTTVQHVDEDGVVIRGTKQPAYAHEYEGDSGAASFGWFDVAIGCDCEDPLVTHCVKEAVVVDADQDGVECYPLRNRDEEETGSVCVELIEYPHPHFEVTYEAAPSWALVKNHLWVGTDIDDVPTMVGKLDMHHFPYFYCDFNGMQVWKQRVEKEVLCGHEDDFAYSIVAYTTMQRVDAEGHVIVGTKQPAYAFEYVGIHGNNARFGWFDIRIGCVCADSPTETPAETPSIRLGPPINFGDESTGGPSPTVPPVSIPTDVPVSPPVSTNSPTAKPETGSPTVGTVFPTEGGTVTNSPIAGSPTVGSGSPTEVGTVKPTVGTGSPTDGATSNPTEDTASPSTSSPISSPTSSPTKGPTASPTTASPTTSSPTDSPSNAPTASPTTSSPTDSPTIAPTASPTTALPTLEPTESPSFAPTTPYCFHAWAYDVGNATCFQELGFEDYGWSNGPMSFSPSADEDGFVAIPLYVESGVGHCALPDMHRNLGGPIGTLFIDYSGGTKLVKITFSVHDRYYIVDSHLYMGETQLYDIGNGPIMDVSEYMFTNEGSTARSQNDTHYTRGCLPENYVIGHAKICGPGRVTQMPTVPGVPTSAPEPTAGPDPTAAPTAVDHELVDLTMEYRVPPSLTRSPTEEEIELLICQTHTYLTVIFEAYLDMEVSILAEDLHWSFIQGETFPVIVDFDIVAHYANETKIPRDVVTEILLASDTEDYIRNFVWESGSSTNYFYNVNSVNSRLEYVSRKPNPGYNSGFCGNLIVTMPTATPTQSPSRGTPSPSGGPTASPTVVPTKETPSNWMFFHSEFQFSYFDEFTARELNFAEFQAFKDATARFYSDSLRAAYPNEFESFELIINFHSFEFDRYYEEYIDFDAVVKTKEGTELERREIYLGLQNADYQGYIYNYLWTFGQDSIFYWVQEVAFNAVCGGHGGCERRFMRQSRQKVRREVST